MGFIIGLLTVLMVLDCIVLILLVLIQLPKKEAGAGLAFGAGTTDALFGAGSGTVLTKITKYAAGIFFAFAILLSLLRNNYYNRNVTSFQENLGKLPVSAPAASAPASRPTTPPAAAAQTLGATNATSTNTLLLSVPPVSTNLSLLPSTNTPTPEAPK
jgi:preprotein translocase subunit SecG